MNKIIKSVCIVLFLGSCAKDVPPAPVARFEAVEVSATREGAIYSFTNLSTNSNIFNWTFGDGGSSIEKHPPYTFKKNGVYNVSLTANGDGGKDQFSQTVKVTTIPETGNFIFWSQIGDKGNTTVTIAGQNVGTITVFKNNNTAPACNTAGFVTVTLKEGTYSFTAKSQGLVPLNWSGTIQVINGTCRSLELTR